MEGPTEGPERAEQEPNGCVRMLSVKEHMRLESALAEATALLSCGKLYVTGRGAREQLPEEHLAMFQRISTARAIAQRSLQVAEEKQGAQSASPDMHWPDALEAEEQNRCLFDSKLVKEELGKKHYVVTPRRTGMSLTQEELDMWKEGRRTEIEKKVYEMLGKCNDKETDKVTEDKDLTQNMFEAAQVDHVKTGTQPDNTTQDPWKHRSAGICCKTCMWFVLKRPEEEDSTTKRVGRCRRHAPTMNGYPVVFENDWCGDHKLNEERI